MGENATRDEQRESLKALMERVDKLMPSPETRALKVWAQLNKESLTVWDLICFCSESLGLAASLFPEFEAPIKALSLNVYATHYRGSSNLIDWENKEENQLDKVNINPTG